MRDPPPRDLLPDERRGAEVKRQLRLRTLHDLWLLPGEQVPLLVQVALSDVVPAVATVQETEWLLREEPR